VATELQNFKIDEVSGVDAPAHSIPGWIVMKSEDGAPQAAAETQLAALYATLGSASCLTGAPEEVRKAAVALNEYVEKQLSAPEPEPSLIEKMKSIFKGKSAPPTAAMSDNDGDDDDEPGKVSKKVKKNKVATPPNGTDDPQATQEAQDVAKAVKKALKKEREEQLEVIAKAMTEEFDGMREVMKAMLDRIENLEGELAGSYQVPGQDFAPVAKAAPSLTEGIMSAFHGNRVTLS
jgi:hypothetical protein